MIRRKKKIPATIAMGRTMKSRARKRPVTLSARLNIGFLVSGLRRRAIYERPLGDARGIRGFLKLLLDIPRLTCITTGR